MRYLLLAALLTIMLIPANTSSQTARLCFDVPTIDDCIDGRFRTYWEQNGGLPVFGYPTSPAAMRQTAEGMFLGQDFERNRFELHPEKPAPYDVLLGRLGDERLKAQGRDWRSSPKGRQTDECLWFSETGHSVCDQEVGIGFKTYWSTHGLQDPRLNSGQRSLALFGLPLTEPSRETNAAGDTVLTQWFERARFEYHPGQQPEFRILLGLLGNETGAGTRPGGGAPFDPASFTLEPRRVVDGLAQPLHATHAGDGSGRIFVVEKAGRIRIVANGTLRPEPFLDITNLVGSSGAEQGLFAIAFHPAYRTNGRFFVHYTDKAGDTVIARYRVSMDTNRADPASATTVLRIDQPYPNHNGGQIVFGPDGYLYIGMGDGGSAGDPQGNGQNRGSLLGKILRLDVDGDAPYAIPPDNPFRSTAGARPEIWALGLRNPWRFSFDRATGDLFIADVGQNELEEIHWTPANGGGKNYGWNIMEGSACYRPASGCNRSGLELPITEYGHSLGCSVTGGFRYRGQDVPAFDTAYFFGDYCSGWLWALAPNGAGGWTRTELLDTSLNVSSFGEDERGELYVTDLRGALYRLDARSR